MPLKFIACLGSQFLLVLESVTAQSPGALRMGRGGNRGVVFSSSPSENPRFLLKNGYEMCVDSQHECPKRGLWFLGRSHHCATLDLRPRSLGASSEHPAGVRSPVAAGLPVRLHLSAARLPAKVFWDRTSGNEFSLREQIRCESSSGP